MTQVVNNGAGPEYFLSRQAHLCIGRGRVVILDLASNSYFALELAAARALAACVHGWPIEGAEGERPPVLQQLLDTGLLTPDRESGRGDATPVCHALPSESLQDRATSSAEKPTFRHLLAFLRAALTVTLALRLVSFKHVVAHVRRRKLSRPRQPGDLEKIHELMKVFAYFHAWFLKRDDECLRTSLMQIQFLAYHGIFPDWVFGVRTDPFFAHCWLQHEHVVINDAVRTTTGMTPILVV